MGEKLQKKKKKKKKKKKQKREKEFTTKNEWGNKEIAKQLERKNQKYAGIDIDIGMKNESKLRKNEAKKI